jgi:hypothetical protein
MSLSDASGEPVSWNSTSMGVVFVSGTITDVHLILHNQAQVPAKHRAEKRSWWNFAECGVLHKSGQRKRDYKPANPVENRYGKNWKSKVSKHTMFIFLVGNWNTRRKHSSYERSHELLTFLNWNIANWSKSCLTVFHFVTAENNSTMSSEVNWVQQFCVDCWKSRGRCSSVHLPFNSLLSCCCRRAWRLVKSTDSSSLLLVNCWKSRESGSNVSI